MGDPYILKVTLSNQSNAFTLMNLPTSTVITGIDSMPILEQAFEAVRTFNR